MKFVWYEDIDKEEKLNGKLFEFELDDTITPELKAEGDARDIVRKIQAERKVMGTSLDEKVNVSLESWPKEFESEIKRKALINSLTIGVFKVTKV